MIEVGREKEAKDEEGLSQGLEGNRIVLVKDALQGVQQGATEPLVPQVGVDPIGIPQEVVDLHTPQVALEGNLLGETLGRLGGPQGVKVTQGAEAEPRKVRLPMGPQAKQHAVTG